MAGKADRYLRQLLLPEFGDAEQEKLAQAKVFIAGAGGLGSPAALYLAAAGIGHLVVCDKDNIELSNLNRQILHSTTDINMAKAESAKNSLQALNPEIKIECFNIEINDETIGTYARNSTIILDCLDNLKTRQVLNSFCIKNKIPMIHAGISNWAGQITLINPPNTACIDCLFESYTEPQGAKPVLGSVVGILGTLQALETIKYIANINSKLENNLVYFDLLNLEWNLLPIMKNIECKTCS